MTDLRANPKTRKHPQLWQSYLIWDELKEMRKRHELRLSSIKAGKSNLDATLEEMFMAETFGKADKEGIWRPVTIQQMETHYRQIMVTFGERVGPIWKWLISIHGIGDHTAAKILAQFDDVGKFATISKFWRFAGHGIAHYWVDDKGIIKVPKAGYQARKAKKGEWILNGVICEKGIPGAERAQAGQVVREYIIPTPEPGRELKERADVRLKEWCSPFNTRLKSELWILGGNFIRQQTPVYVQIYYEEKLRLRVAHPEKIKVNGKWKYNDGHLHNMAMRKMRKIFLSHLWVKWRESEGLPVSEPYVQAIMGHTNIVEPQER